MSSFDPFYPPPGLLSFLIGHGRLVWQWLDRVPILLGKKLPAASGLTRQWPTKDVTSFVISGCEFLHGEMLNEKLTNIHQQSTPYSSTNTNLEDPNKKWKYLRYLPSFQIYDNVSISRSTATIENIKIIICENFKIYVFLRAAICKWRGYGADMQVWLHPDIMHLHDSVSFTFLISGIFIMHLLHDSYIVVLVSFTIAISDNNDPRNRQQRQP